MYVPLDHPNPPLGGVPREEGNPQAHLDLSFLSFSLQRIPNLLTLLSSALTALLPPDPDAPKVLHEDGSVQEEEERFVDSAREYYQELDVSFRFLPFLSLLSTPSQTHTNLADFPHHHHQH